MQPGHVIFLNMQSVFPQLWIILQSPSLSAYQVNLIFSAYHQHSNFVTNTFGPRYPAPTSMKPEQL